LTALFVTNTTGPMSISRREFTAMLAAWTLPATVRATSAPWFPTFDGPVKSHGFEPLEVQGTLPAELEGTLVRNGAMGFIAPDGQRYEHWFDGDGGILAIRLGQGKAEGASRLIESPGLLKERAKQARLHLGFGSTVDRPLLKLLGTKMKNVANTNVIAVGDELWALVESCPPTRIDPETFARLDSTDLNGVVQGGFSAHPHKLAGSDQLINTGIQFGLKNTLRLYSVSPSGKATVLFKQEDAHAPLVHDFALTDRSAVLLLPPLRMDMGKVLKAKGAVADGFVWEPERGTEVLVVPLDAPDQPIRFTVDPFFQWHFANAHQSGSQVIVDLVRYADFENNQAIGNIITGEPNGGQMNGRLYRMRIDIKRRTHTMEAVGVRSGEFPQVNPLYWGHPHRFVYMAEHASPDVARLGLPDTLCRYDIETGQSVVMPSATGTYPGEPLVVPKRGRTEESAAWILSMAYQAQTGKSGLLIFDGESPGTEPVASAWFNGPRHTTFHGQWLSTV